MADSAFLSRLPVKGAVFQSVGPEDAFKVPLLNDEGKFDPSLISNTATIYEVANAAARLALSAATPGDFCLQADSSSIYILKAVNPALESSWIKLSTTLDENSILAGYGLVKDEETILVDSTVIASIQQLAAKQDTLVSGTNIKTLNSESLLGSGNIQLNKSSVGLSNVDNTSDLNKPISTDVQTALNLKANDNEVCKTFSASAVFTINSPLTGNVTINAINRPDASIELSGTLGIVDSPTFNQVTASQFNGISGYDNAGALTMNGALTGPGGSINTNGSDYASGGSINTAGGNIGANGGSINTSGGDIDVPGGNINTSAGGGSIDTTGTGSIGFGNAGTRTTLTGTATEDRSINLPDKNGVVALTSDALAEALIVQTNETKYAGIYFSNETLVNDKPVFYRLGTDKVIRIEYNSLSDNRWTLFDGNEAKRQGTLNADRPWNGGWHVVGIDAYFEISQIDIKTLTGSGFSVLDNLWANSSELPVPKLKLINNLRGDGTIITDVPSIDSNTFLSAESLPLQYIPVVTAMDLTEEQLASENIFLECVIYDGVKTRIPSPWKVFQNNITGFWMNQWIHPWPQNFKTRTGQHNFGKDSQGNLNLVKMSRPNHFPVASNGEVIPVYSFLNGRFAMKEIFYRASVNADGSEIILSQNLYVPLNFNVGNNLTPRWAYSRKFSPFRFACRYVRWNPIANNGRGEIISGPMSRTVKVWYQPFPFNTDHVLSSTYQLAIATLNEKYLDSPKMNCWLE